MSWIGVLRHFTLLNGLLLLASGLFAYGFLFPQWQEEKTFSLPKAASKPDDQKQKDLPKPQNPSPQAYVAIAEQNLFHPDRIIPPEKKAENALPKPEFVLYGILMAPDGSLAYLEDKKAPITTPGRGQRQTVLKKGELLSGFSLKDILADRVVMARGEEILTVYLDDPGSPKKREVITTSKTPAPPPGMSVPPGRPAPTPPSLVGPLPSPSMSRPPMVQPPGFPRPGPPMPPGFMGPPSR